MRFLDIAGESEGPVHTRTYAQEVEIGLSAFDSILNGEKAVYGSSELTTGKRLNALFHEHGVRERRELKAKLGEEGFRRQVWDPNVREANAFARELRFGLGGEIVITPAPFVSPGWTQGEYLAFWETVIRTRCKAVYFSEDWEYSSGCAFEFAVARDAGLPTFHADGRELSLEDGIDRIAAAAAELEAEGLDTRLFRDALAHLATRGCPSSGDGRSGIGSGAMKTLAAFLAMAILALSGARSPAQEPPVQDPVQFVLRARFPTSGAAPRLVLEGRAFRSSPLLPCFYERRGFAPAWSDAGILRPAAGELLSALEAAGDDGLRSEDYRPEALRNLASAGGTADLDLLLSDAFLTFAAHLRNGKVNPEAIYRDCALGRDDTDLATVLEEALRQGRVRAALASLAPPHRGYARLREALSRYRRIAARGGPEPVPPGPTLRAGDRGERIAALRARLAEAAASDAAEPLASTESPDLFDAPLEEAVRRFQQRHGLEDDGIAGPATLAELNQRTEDHVRQIEVNLERWRWLPHDLGQRHVLINIAAFRLDVVEDGRTALDMRVIVGKPYTRTPMFSSAMNSVVLNPSWNVPRSIVPEVLARARKDPSYLQREDFEMLPGPRLRQRPGPRNALGQIKFVFPNRFGVYLHDTSAPALFGSTVRTFSHGCIRVEKPFDLAVWALRDDPRWTAEAIRAGIEAGKERTVPLPHKIPVHVAYWTAWVGDDGTLRLGRDVYQRDAGLARLLQPV